MSEGDELVGHWRKVTAAPCSSAYPDELELRPGGRYVGRARPDAREHPRWDLGSWAVEGPGRVAVSTANDALVRYGYTFDGAVLAFEDDAGCRWAYEREG